jgi:hypothetical protein
MLQQVLCNPMQQEEEKKIKIELKSRAEPDKHIAQQLDGMTLLKSKQKMTRYAPDQTKQSVI